jgi:hypothetical protein
MDMVKCQHVEDATEVNMHKRPLNGLTESANPLILMIDIVGGLSVNTWVFG